MDLSGPERTSFTSKKTPRTATPVADLTASVTFEHSSVFQWTMCSCTICNIYVCIWIIQTYYVLFSNVNVGYKTKAVKYQTSITPLHRKFTIGNDTDFSKRESYLVWTVSYTAFNIAVSNFFYISTHKTDSAPSQKSMQM